MIFYSSEYAMQKWTTKVLMCVSYVFYILETPLYFHMGEIIDGLDMRAEVGDLTRNIVIQAEMQKTCYGNNQCQFFNYDTFGGHIKVC